MSAKKKSSGSGNKVIQLPLPETKLLLVNEKQPRQAVEYTNRKGKTYYLHIGKTKKGNPRYLFSTETTGELAEAIPAEYEIYENPNALVFLRKSQPKDISDDELAILEHELNAHAKPTKFKIDVRGKVVTIFWSDHNVPGMGKRFSFFGLARTEELCERHAHFTPIFRFTLVDQQERLFIAERFCFRGSIDDWMHLAGGGPDSLEILATRYVRHLGKESFYELL